jgi:hypothetical protein
MVNDCVTLRSRTSEESKFKGEREKSERKLEEVFSRGSEQPGRLKSFRFFDVKKHGPEVLQEAASAFHGLLS